MRQTYALIAVLTGMLALAPALAEPIPFPATVGEPYTGRMTAEAFPAGGGPRIHRARGKAEVSFAAGAEDRLLVRTMAFLEDGGSLDLGVTLAC
jgi:hypothetical protein